MERSLDLNQWIVKTFSQSHLTLYWVDFGLEMRFTFYTSLPEMIKYLWVETVNVAFLFFVVCFEEELPNSGELLLWKLKSRRIWFPSNILYHHFPPSYLPSLAIIFQWGLLSISSLFSLPKLRVLLTCHRIIFVLRQKIRSTSHESLDGRKEWKKYCKNEGRSRKHDFERERERDTGKEGWRKGNNHQELYKKEVNSHETDLGFGNKQRSE